MHCTPYETNHCSADNRMSEIPQPLLEDIAAGKCLPFVGAGFSLNAKLPVGNRMPDWQGLTEILATAAGASPKEAGPIVAASYERRFGRVQLIEAIRDALHSDEIEPADAHVAFAGLPFDTIYTTNFDLLLEDANALIRKPFRSLVGELQIPFHGGPLSTNIVKMHGDLRHEEHIIVSQEDYDQFLEKYPVISTHLSAMLITRTALFLGYSLSDPDFNHIREVVRSRLGRFQRMSYIIQFNQPPKKVEAMLDQHLHVINLKPKRGQTHGSVLATFFRSIQEELDARAGAQIRAAKPEVFEDIPQEKIDETSRAPDASTLLSSSSNLCFVLMPFDKPFDDVYRLIIAPAVREAGLEVMRADQIFTPGSIMEQIRSAIQQSRLCIADLTGRNPNVLYELGIAQTLGKPSILMAQDINDVPFDVRQYRVIQYENQLLNVEKTQKTLLRTISVALGSDRLDEALSLIENGMVRAGVAILGVLLEQTLKHILITSDLVDVRLRDSFSRGLTMGRMIEMLSRAQRILPAETKKLRRAVEMRNRAVHDLGEPAKASAMKVYADVSEFIRRETMNAEQEPGAYADKPRRSG